MSFRDEVYQTLKKAIIMLKLEPGQRLNDKELAEDFGISRTPVREALKRLEDEGLVESVPGSATRVTPLKPEEAKHAFTVVAALHSLAARLAVPLLKDSDIKMMEVSNNNLKVSLEQNDIIQAIQADESFHDVFYGLTPITWTQTTLFIFFRTLCFEIYNIMTLDNLKTIGER